MQHGQYYQSPGYAGQHWHPYAEPCYGPMQPPPQEHTVQMPPSSSPDGPMMLWMIHENVRARHRFIVKVYLILFLQLTVVAGFTAAMLLIEPAHEWMVENGWMYWVAFAMFFVVYLLLVCCEGLRRRFPQNVIFLAIFTLAAAYMTAVTSSHYSAKSVLIAAGITAASCLLVSLFALQTWIDLTKWTGIMCIITLAVCVFGFVLVIVFFAHPECRTISMVYSGIIAVLFMVWLAIDTQMLLGNKKISLTVDEYVFGALQLFVDILYIFWNLLQLVGGIRGN